MKLKNLNNYTNQELRDVLTQVKAHLQITGNDWLNVTVANYQEQSDDERDDITHYEIYHSSIAIERETTLEEITEQLYQNEKLIKTYKTKKGLLQALLHDNDITGSYYRLHTII